MGTPRRDWTQSRIEKDDERLKLAARLGRERERLTPFLFFEQAELQRGIDYFRSFLPRVKLHYAVKANPHPEVIRYFQQQGLAFDAASEQEVRLLTDLGIPPKAIILTNPNKQLQCVDALLQLGLSAFTYDSPGEIQKIVSAARALGVRDIPEAILRLKIDSQDVQIDLNSKFGVSLEEAAELIKYAADLGVSTAGLAFHVGTQSFFGHNYLVGVKSSILVARAVREQHGIELRLINIGGGFPDQNILSNEGVSYQEFFRDIAEACALAEREGFELYAEPGRVLVSSAASLVTSVIGISERSGRRSVYLNDGVFGCYNGKFFDHKSFVFYPLPGPNRSEPFSYRTAPCVVWGPTCDSLDLIQEGVELPVDLQVGDFICSTEMGAYSLSTVTNYNGFALRDSVMIKAPTRSDSTATTSTATMSTANVRQVVPLKKRVAG